MEKTKAIRRNRQIKHKGSKMEEYEEEIGGKKVDKIEEVSYG